MWGAWAWGAWAWGGWVWGRDYLTLDCPMTKVEAARRTSKQKELRRFPESGAAGTYQEKIFCNTCWFVFIRACLRGGVWIPRSLRFTRVCWGLPFSGLRIRCAPWAADGVHLPQPVF